MAGLCAGSRVVSPIPEKSEARVDALLFPPPPATPADQRSVPVAYPAALAGNSRNRQNVVCHCRNCHLPTENVEQHSDAPRVLQVIKYRELLGERPRDQAHGAAYLQLAAELQDAARVGCCDQRLDHSARNRMRLIAPHHQPRYPKGAVNTAPLMAGEIEDDEHIAGKYGASTVLNLCACRTVLCRFG